MQTRDVLTVAAAVYGTQTTRSHAAAKVATTVLNVMVLVDQDRFLILLNAAIRVKVQVWFMATKGFVSEQDVTVARPVNLVIPRDGNKISGGKLMIFRQLNKTPCKTYLISSEKTKEAIIIDPVLENLNEYISIIKNEGFKLTHVLDTHTHADHISGSGALADKMSAVYVMHQNSPVRCVAFHVPDGFDYHLSNIPVKIMHTPGHTKDSICLVFQDRILTGDTLFLDEGGAGRTDLPGGDPGEHWESIQKIMKLPDNLIVYPAHDYRGREPSSLGEQKKQNSNLQPRTKEAYIKWLTDMKLGAADWMKDVLSANYACARNPKAAWIPVDAPACEVKGTLPTNVNEQQVPTIPVSEVKRRIQSNQLNNTIILDVREPAELKGELGVINGALNIPVGQLTQRIIELEKYKEKDFITVCRSGGRAHTAAAILLQLGFKKVFNMSGGMMAFHSAEKTK